MTAAPAARPLASDPHELTDADYTTLMRPLRRVLTAAVSSAQLITLELQACGIPELSMLVRSSSAGAVAGMTVWPTVIGPDDWHDGLLLVATAATADPQRRVAVHSAGILLADLLTAERRRMNAELLASRAVELAGVDALTGLGNRRTWRRALDEEAARATRYDRSSAVVVLDLDGLKGINDQQGHAAGDAHLQRAAAAIHAVARSVDVVCRLGGDEFGVLAPETAGDGATRLADRLREQLASVGVQASIGVATTTDGDLERAWHEADTEMYSHKRSRTPA